MPVYLIRHGQSEFNAAPHHGQDPMIFDAPLTELGQAQAMRVREEVKGLGIKHVISSPLTRAIQTALTIFEGSAPITIETTHREWLTHSCDVGRSPDVLAGEFPDLAFGHLDQHWWHEGPVNENGVPVEPEQTFHARVKTFDDVLAAAETRPVAIVGHGNFFQEMIGRMMENCEVHAYLSKAAE
jgi:glucosyl-3-phosphoglycerate phosphatase